MVGRRLTLGVDHDAWRDEFDASTITMNGFIQWSSLFSRVFGRESRGKASAGTTTSEGFGRVSRPLMTSSGTASGGCPRQFPTSLVH